MYGAWVQTFRRQWPDGQNTTVHCARYPRDRWAAQIHRLQHAVHLPQFCARHGHHSAINGGFYVHGGLPLGEMWLDGTQILSEPFTSPWDQVRACVDIQHGHPRIARRDHLDHIPSGDRLQAGPLLISQGQPVTGDTEGFTQSTEQFDSDITAIRHPRSALGVNDDHVIAVVVDGRHRKDSGATLPELAQIMLSLGAQDAINLDGGVSSSLVYDGQRLNQPRLSNPDRDCPTGRPQITVITFAPRPDRETLRLP